MWVNIIIIILIFAGIQIATDIIKKSSKAIAAAPGKGFKKVINAFRTRKLNKAKKAYENALWECDIKARLNAAKQNDTYAKDKKVRAKQSKLELIEYKYKK